MQLVNWKFSCGHNARTGDEVGTKTPVFMMRTEKCWLCKDEDIKVENELQKAEFKDQEIIALWELQTTAMLKLLQKSAEDEDRADMEKLMENCNSLFLKKVNHMASKTSTLVTLPDSAALYNQFSKAIQGYEKIVKLAKSAAELKLERRSGRITNSSKNKELRATITAWTNIQKSIGNLNVDGIVKTLDHFKEAEATILVTLKR